MSFYRDSPYMLAVGGSKGTLALWDTSENEGVERRFGSRVQGVASAAASTDISSSFKNAFDLGEELARQEEAEREQKAQQSKKKASKSKAKK